MRYGEAPTFLEVASVINQYSLERNVEGGMNWGGLLASTKSVGAGGSWSDRPTITYSPVTGERYVRSMLIPIPPDGILVMVQGGWPVDFIFGLTVRSINGIAAPTRSLFLGQTRTGTGFSELMTALRRIQESGDVGIRVTEGPEGRNVVISFRPHAAGEEDDDLRTVRTILGLEEGQNDFRVVYGAVAADRNEIAFLTRSMLDILVELSASVDVPPEDIAAGRTRAAPDLTDQDESTIIPFLRIHSSKSEPAGAFTAVHYRDRWFYVDDGDMVSKRSLSFLLVRLSLSESGGAQMAPLVTVGAGG